MLFYVLCKNKNYSFDILTSIDSYTLSLKQKVIK